MIHVCFSLYDKTGRYSKFTGTTICSIFENANTPPLSITVHILHDNTLTADNRDKFIYLAGCYGQSVKFYNIEELCAEKFSEIVRLIPFAKTSRLTVAALYRLLIPDLLPASIEKIIYLDSDIIVNLNIKELWRIELGENILAAAPEAVINYLDHPFHSKTKILMTSGLVDYEDYFNSGVMLMNLNYLRDAEDFIMSGVKWCGKHPQCDSLDQDILNYLFSKNYLKLPEKFDVFVIIDRRRGYNLIREAIYHYGGWTCTLDLKDPFNRLWMNYFTKTPWFDADSIGRLCEGFLKIRGEQEKAILNLSAVVSGKTRAFIVAENGVKLLLENFSVREDEEVLVVSGGTPIQKIIDVMNASRGEKIFFFLLPNFPFNVLEDAGLVHGRDFFNGMEFLPDNFNSHQLLKSM